MLQTVLCVSYGCGGIKRNGDKSRPIACSGQKQGGGVTQSKMNWDVNCKFTFLLLRNTSLYLQGVLLYLVLGHIRQHLRGKTLSMFSPPPTSWYDLLPVSFVTADLSLELGLRIVGVNTTGIWDVTGKRCVWTGVWERHGWYLGALRKMLCYAGDGGSGGTGAVYGCKDKRYGGTWARVQIERDDFLSRTTIVLYISVVYIFLPIPLSVSQRTALFEYAKNNTLVFLQRHFWEVWLTYRANSSSTIYLLMWIFIFN